MSQYRVKLGDQIVEVDGVGGLIELVQQHRLGPEDPVFIPASGKWHYARSIRQLREHFPEAPAVPPPEPTPPPDPPEEESEGARVLTLRRGRWTPDGKGVEVPVFAYDVDADPPRSFRTVIILGVALAGVFSLWLVNRYVHEVNSFYENRSSDSAVLLVPSPKPTPTPKATPAIVVRATPHATPTNALASATRTPPATPTPVPLPSFDAVAMRTKVARASITPVARPDQFGDALRSDLTKLAVPIHEAVLSAEKGARDAAVPFALRVDFSPSEKADAASQAKSRFLIIAMVGRRIEEMHLHVRSFHLRTISGKKVLSDVDVPAELATKAWQGSASGPDVSVLFVPKPR